MSEYDKFHRLLGWVLIEIRSAQDLREAQSLADIVHNLPAKISAGCSPSDITCELRMRAERLDMAKWLEKRLQFCERGPAGR